MSLTRRLGRESLARNSKRADESFGKSVREILLPEFGADRIEEERRKCSQHRARSSHVTLEELGATKASRS